MSRLAVVMLMVVLCMGLAWGQYGTMHLPSAVPWQGDDVQVSTQVRIFEGSGNQTYNANARGRMGENVEVQIGWFSMSTEGEDPIAEVIRRSQLHLLTLNALWQVQSGDWRMGFRGGGEFPVRVPEGINTAMVASAPEFRAIPIIAAVVEFGDPDGTLYLFEAKGVGWNADMPITGVAPTAINGFNGVANPNVVEGFGNLFIVGAGVSHKFGDVRLMADLAYPLSGDNSINEVTNAVEQALVWSAGGSYLFGGPNDITLTLGVTNAAGPTPATSTLAAPSDSAGFVAGASVNW